MFIFWKGKTMVDYRDDNAKYGNEETNRENGYGENKYGENGHNGCGSNCGCECCQCKRIFMMLVVLILVFIAGIMVGNCGRCRYADNYYYGPMFARHHNNMSKPKKFHRGMQEIAPTADNVAAKNRQGKQPGAKRQGYPDGQAYQNGQMYPNGQTYPNGQPYPGNQAYPDGQIGGFIIEVVQGY